MILPPCFYTKNAAIADLEKSIRVTKTHHEGIPRFYHLLQLHYQCIYVDDKKKVEKEEKAILYDYY